MTLEISQVAVVMKGKISKCILSALHHSIMHLQAAIISLQYNLTEHAKQHLINKCRLLTLFDAYTTA